MCEYCAPQPQFSITITLPSTPAVAESNDKVEVSSSVSDSPVFTPNEAVVLPPPVISPVPLSSITLPPNRCQGIKYNGHKCTNIATAGTDFCATHNVNPDNSTPEKRKLANPEKQCTAITKKHTRCLHPKSQGSDLCKYHLPK